MANSNMQASGVGKDSKRHDLDGVPKLQDSSLQQGDVQQLEQGQKALKPKRAPQGAKAGGSPRPKKTGKPNLQVPDAIDFIGGRAGGTFDPGRIGTGKPPFDIDRWRPLLQQLARNPMASGPLTTQILEQIGNANRAPRGNDIEVIDMNAAEDALAAQLGVE